jgi:phosphoenolpyruvate carboxykinase (ATP)
MPKDDLKKCLDSMLKKHKGLNVNPSRSAMIREIVHNREALVSANGALATWTPWESTGRSPKDTYIVRDNLSEKKADWDSPNNNAMEPSTFNMIWEDALNTLSKKPKLYITDRVLGADVRDALPVRTISDRALPILFTDNMFRPIQKNIEKSHLKDNPFTLLVLPYDRLEREKYKGRLRLTNPEDKNSTSRMAISMDMSRRLGIVYGSAYLGSVKKLMFTVMNCVMPEIGVLPIHCSANEGEKGDCALMLGLSGTGKTSLSADPTRKLLGDDEHGWSDYGTFNFEYGCYAKLINLRKDKEPEIWNAVLHEAPYIRHGAIVENAMMYPDGRFDLDDKRYTENSRASYPLAFLTNIKKSSTSTHPKTIIFLTADANGVLPPIAKLTTNQAMLWFLMGYTSKLAGTETGIIEPVSTFSRFFGQPFMPLVPGIYTSMLGEKLERHKTQVYLINTGWSGGPYGKGERIDITLTRRMLHAALDGELEKAHYREDKLFHVHIPTQIEGIPDKMLEPSSTWCNRHDCEDRAKKLAEEFRVKFDKAFRGKGISREIEIECPGK